MRLVMFGTGPFAVPTLRALYGSSHRIVALVTQPPRVVRGKVVAADSPMRDVAQAHGTPILDPVDVNADSERPALAALDADLYVVADYGQILSPALLGLVQHGAINLHGSLLPKYRGAAPINWALYHGDTVTGVSVIHMTPRVDAGPVLAQASTPIDPDEDAVALETRLASLGAPLICDTIKAIETGTTSAVPQDLAQATRARRLRKTDGAVDWRRAAAEIKNQVRALAPWPRTYTYLHRPSAAPLRLIVGRVEIVPAAESAQLIAAAREAEPGSVVSVGKKELCIATGAGVIRMLEIQPAGRPMMAVGDFLRGHPVQVGERFSSDDVPAS